MYHPAFVACLGVRSSSAAAAECGARSDKREILVPPRLWEKSCARPATECASSRDRHHRTDFKKGSWARVLKRNEKRRCGRGTSATQKAAVSKLRDILCEGPSVEEQVVPERARRANARTRSLSLSRSVGAKRPLCRMRRNKPRGRRKPSPNEQTHDWRNVTRGSCRCVYRSSD